jgi:hypothetical protein
MPRAGPLVSPELAALLESGLSLVVGTSDAELRPDCSFAAGLRVHPGGDRVTLFLGVEPAAGAIANLRANGAVAITGSRPADYRTFQLKGRAVRVEPVPEGERAVLLACREALAAQLERVGWARSHTRRLSVWPCVAVEVALDAVFEQTPGPRAGSPLGGP